MDKLEIKKQAIELAKAYIQNSNIVLEKTEFEAEEKLANDEVWIKSGNTKMSFKLMVEYFERQLEQIYNN